MRWIELGAFTAVFRTHEGNIPEVNHQFYSDEETLGTSSASPNLRGLKPYRMELVKEASEMGLPSSGIPSFIIQTIPRCSTWVPVHGWHRAMVAPVLDPDTDTVEVYLPAEMGPPLDGREIRLAGARRLRDGLGAHRRPAVFYREDSAEGIRFRRALGVGTVAA